MEETQRRSTTPLSSALAGGDGILKNFVTPRVGLPYFFAPGQFDSFGIRCDITRPYVIQHFPFVTYITGFKYIRQHSRCTRQSHNSKPTSSSRGYVKVSANSCVDIRQWPCVLSLATAIHVPIPRQQFTHRTASSEHCSASGMPRLSVSYKWWPLLPSHPRPPRSAHNDRESRVRLRIGCVTPGEATRHHLPCC